MKGGDLAARIRWVLESGRVKNASRWSSEAKVNGEPFERQRVSTMLDRLEKDPTTTFELASLNALADAAGVSRVWFTHGVGDPDETFDVGYRYDSLREVIEHPSNATRWSAEAIAVVKSQAARADEDPGQQFWKEQLDRFTSALKLAELPMPTRPLADPTSDLDEPPRKK